MHKARTWSLLHQGGLESHLCFSSYFYTRLYYRYFSFISYFSLMFVCSKVSNFLSNFTCFGYVLTSVNIFQHIFYYQNCYRRLLCLSVFQYYFQHEIRIPCPEVILLVAKQCQTEIM